MISRDTARLQAPVYFPRLKKTDVPSGACSIAAFQSSSGQRKIELSEQLAGDVLPKGELHLIGQDKQFKDDR
eukprot:1656895-Rhodomonas_salina.3